MSAPFWGHVFPSLAVAEELVHRGHHVTFVTGAEMADAVRSVGADFLRYESAFEGVDMYRLMTEAEPNAIPMTLYDEGMSMLRSVEEHVGKDVPDLVAYDIATSLNVGRVLAASWSRPAMTVIPLFASNGRFSTMQSVLDPDSAQVSAPPPRFSEQMELFGLGALVPRLAELLVSRGITEPVDDFLSGPEDFNLVCLPRAFQYAGDTFDERFAFVGPCLGKRRGLGEWTPPGSGHPVVLISLGTVFNRQLSFFRTFVRAFTDVPVHVVISLGKGVDPDVLRPLPPNVEVHRWVPHHAVLEHARALVTHGGTGSVMEALHAGCPVLVMPLSRDAQVTGRRIAELGLGRMVQPEEVTATTLRRHVLDIISDDAITRQVRQMQRATVEAGGALRAADETERFLRRTRRH
ncbi:MULTISPECIES: glycosyltransferase [Streptomyces]|nr:MULTISPECIES: glycosyltransferase [Streptomyces]MYS96584.1 glycosyl transferase [Streptomyces sp. SID5469]BBJ48563.1 glycosyl transferase [Streptomyces avermitilis]GDY79321.1 glycosyl transferase [Streptomyces avermitilis]GDY87850.1 glycosyl transferase [Streptomyces avermitilis]